MKYFLCLMVLAIAACAPNNTRYPTGYTGGPPPITWDAPREAKAIQGPAYQKHICPLDAHGAHKACCDKPCCADGKCKTCCKDGVCQMQCCRKDAPCQKPSASKEKSSNGAGHSAHAHHEKQTHAGVGKLSDVYSDAMDKMHAAMGAYTPTGDADVDFVLGMVPHHQGAVDMAEVLLEKGDDPYLRRLGRDIIVAQKREIAFMNYWLATRGALPDTNVSNVNVAH